MKNTCALLALLLLLNCSTHKTGTPAEPGLSQQPEAISFAGKPLLRKIADSASLAKSDSLIAAIHAKTELTEDDYIAIGRALSATSRFKMAAENYSEGLSKYPKSYKLLRHRGHRYINLHQLDKAITDLTKAEELIRPEKEVFEYDETGKQGPSYQHQIWYHIGVYHFLKKEYTLSAMDFEKSLAAAHAGKDIAGASDWLYNAYQRSGEKEKAANVLKRITPDMAIEDKEYPYFRRLLLYKGSIKPEELVDAGMPIEKMSLLHITKLYGLANWHLYKGDKDIADSIHKKILLSKEWAGFAYLEAEMDEMK